MIDHTDRLPTIDRCVSGIAMAVKDLPCHLADDRFPMLHRGLPRHRRRASI